ncbi:hypothetical protein GCM10012275_54600 [Longimycelium tulufanense]|uniref:Minor capsid protein n=1 Tax=Longimycelium tulufanense TaxID=907463 RepID=A0A8J3CH93_9PSEU|nr:phage minor capsid protein [Longimycelium tulufanense]GGM77035.1 hypothetical protein GCM10012275_54600 [Longimycelium tulufanense]
MPVDRSLAEDLATHLVRIYTTAQSMLALELGRRLADGLDAPDWAGQKLAQIGLLRSFAERFVQLLDSEMRDEVEQAIALAYHRGGQAALDELGRLAGGTARELGEIREALPGTEAIQRLAWSLSSTLQGTHVRILRWQLDAYRQVIAETVATGTLMGTESRLRTAQRAWDRLLSRGITGFVDRAGRRWELASYVEMATRTATAQAAVQGHLDRLGGAGLDLVIVSNAPQECRRCRDWEGRVLSRNGPDGRRTIQVEHTTQDRTIRVEVAGTVAEGVRSGLLHPNCRHSLSAYLPGVTKAPTHTADPEGDKARQRLRALERKVREAKLKAAAALNPTAKRRHEAQVRALQTQIRVHVEATGLHRQRHREQVGLAR